MLSKKISTFLHSRHKFPYTAFYADFLRAHFFSVLHCHGLKITALQKRHTDAKICGNEGRGISITLKKCNTHTNNNWLYWNTPHLCTSVKNTKTALNCLIKALVVKALVRAELVVGWVYEPSCRRGPNGITDANAGVAGRPSDIPTPTQVRKKNWYVWDSDNSANSYRFHKQ